MKEKFILIFTLILIVVTGCNKKKVNIEENIKSAVINQARFNDQFKSLSVGALSVKSMDKYDFLFTGKLYEITYILRHPMVYFYAIQKADSIFILGGIWRFKKPEQERNIVSFLSYQSLKIEQDICSFIEIYLKVITSNYPDSLINTIQDIKGLKLSEDEGGKYVKWQEDRAKIYVDPLLVRPLSTNRSTIMRSEKIDIFFNTISYYTGYIYFNKISIDDQGLYNSERIELLRIIPGQAP